MRNGIGDFYLAVRCTMYVHLFMWKNITTDERKKSVMFDFNLDKQIINSTCKIGHITYNSKMLLTPKMFDDDFYDQNRSFILKCKSIDE